MRGLSEFFTQNADAFGLTKIRRHDFPHYASTAGGVVGRILRGELIVVGEDEIDSDDCSPVSLAEIWSRDKAIVIQSVMIADRLEHLTMLTEFAMSPDTLLLLDRYKMSGMVYGAADGLEELWLKIIQAGLPDADLNILIDISIDESRQRRPERRDYYETNFEKLQRVRDGYLDGFRFAFSEEYAIVDGMRDQTAILLQLIDLIRMRRTSLIHMESQL